METLFVKHCVVKLRGEITSHSQNKKVETVEVEVVFHCGCNIDFVYFFLFIYYLARKKNPLHSVILLYN